MTEVKLSDVTVGIFDGKHGGCKEAQDTGYFFVSVKDLTEYEIDYSNAKQISKDEFDEIYSRTNLEAGDVIYANTGDTIGKSVYIKENKKNPNTSFQKSIAVLKPNREVIHDRFLFYLLKYETPRLREAATGSAQKNLLLSTMRAFKTILPSMEVQIKIAKILGDIDDKVMLNNQINRNLSEQLDALYDNWFGKYKPFNMGIGGDPNYELEDGWHIEDIYAIADIIYGAPFASKLFNTEGEGKPIVRIRDLKNQELCTYTPEEHPKGYLLQPGDIVVGMDGEFKPYIWGNEEAWLNQRVCVFNNRRGNGKAYVYCTIKPLLYSVEATEVATTVIHIGKKDYDEFRVVLPPEDVLAEFEAISKPMFDQIVEGQLENRRLTKLRDSLLPKLMSGELDVSNLTI